MRQNRHRSAADLPCKNANHRHRRLLRARRERPRHRRAAEPRDELPPSHSITSSARPSSVGGMSRPSALAVLRLMTSSNFVGCWTGRSAGFSPLRIRRHRCRSDDRHRRGCSVAHQAAGHGVSRSDRSQAAGACRQAMRLSRRLSKNGRPTDGIGPSLRKVANDCSIGIVPALGPGFAGPMARPPPTYRCRTRIRAGRINETADRPACGTSARSNSSRFARPAGSATSRTPVALPPGRLRLATRPNRDWVAADAEHDRNRRRRSFGGDCRVSRVPATITATRRRTRSADCSAGSRSS